MRYTIHKRIDCPVEFKGLVAQWLWWLGGGILGLLFLFAILYLLSVSLLVCVFVIIVLGTLLFWLVFRMSKQYGKDGLKKKTAARLMPKQIKGCMLE
ncbi:MAG: DUF4133 domain-containing protein [Bacteroidota bacterium]